MVQLQVSWHDTITEFGKEFGFNIWDWSAVLISFCSVLIAICSFIVAFKTFKSQKKTEKNTTPAINKEVQLFLVNNKLKEAYESFIHLLILQISLEGIEVDGSKYRVKPTSQFWDLVRLKVTDLHEEIFYNKINEFTHFHTFADFVDIFNNDIELLHDTIENSEIDASFKKTALKKCIENLFPIIQLWYKCLRESFNIDNKEISNILDTHIINCTDLSVERIFKIRNVVLNSNVEVIKYDMQEHPGSQYISSNVDSLCQLLVEFIAVNKIDVEINNFKENTFRWIDSVMMNTLYCSEGPLISFINNGNAGSGNVSVANPSQTIQPQSNNSNSCFSEITTTNYPSTWLYQIVKIK